MLEINGLTAWRGARLLFENLHCRLPAASVLWLRGANGAGKTTLLRVLAGLTLPESGTIAWDRQVRNGGLRELACYSGHEPALNHDLTVGQNLRFFAQIGCWSADWPSLLDPLGLWACRDLEVRRLSAGQRRRAGLVRVLLSAAPVWLLDEPFTHLDPVGRAFIEGRIATHVRERRGVIIVTTHDDLKLNGVEAETLTLGMR